MNTAWQAGACSFFFYFFFLALPLLPLFPLLPPKPWPDPSKQCSVKDESFRGERKGRLLSRKKEQGEEEIKVKAIRSINGRPRQFRS